VAQVCASCGTEVDEDAIFCPTCGLPIQSAAEPQLPPAPDWPSSPRAPEPMASRPAPVEPAAPEPSLPDIDETQSQPASASWGEPQTDPGTPVPEAPPSPPAAEDVPPWRRGVAFRPTPVPPPPAADEPSGEPQEAQQRATWDAAPADAEPVPSWRASPPPAEVPPPAVAAPVPRAVPETGLRPEPTVVVPETIGGWIGSIGAAVGVLALFLPWQAGFGYTASWGLASGVNLLFGIVLLALLVGLLLPNLVPGIPRRNLWIAGIGLVGVGIGLDRLGLPLTGMGATVFLIAMLLVAGAGLLAELGLDRRTGGDRP